MNYIDVYNDFEKIHGKDKPLKRVCLNCKRSMRLIKNDFKSRCYCKKCYLKMEEDRKIKEILYSI